MNRSVFRYGGSSEGVLVLVYVPGIASLPHHIFVLSNPTTQPTRRSVKYGNSRFWLRIHPEEPPRGPNRYRGKVSAISQVSVRRLGE